MVLVTAETVVSDSHAEQVYLSLHRQASLFYLRRTTSTIRKFFELFWMLLAISGFAALICLHLAFVYRGNPLPVAASTIASSSNIRQRDYHPFLSIPSTCLPSIPGFQRDAEVTHLVLLEGGPEGASSFAWQIDTGGQNRPANKGSRECTVSDSWSTCTSPSTGNVSAVLGTGAEVYFTFSKTKGFAYLTPNLTAVPNTHGISTQIVAISKTDVRCFGEPFLQQAVFRLLGPDLVMMNWLLAVSDGTGFIYNPRKDKIVDVEQYPITNVRNANNRFPSVSAGNIFDATQWSNWFRPWTSKIKTAIKTCLIYFISTNLVSFLLRVAQERILELSLQIQSHQQENRSIIPLFVTHVADCFVFIPITVGVLFYLKEFYQGDWIISLTFLAVVFICELFSFFSVRTLHGRLFFPRTFFLLFCLVHFYLFSFPFGFSYVACAAIVCFMLQCVTFFWNRYEVPAVALGMVALQNQYRVTAPNSSNNNASENGNATIASRQSISPNQAVLSIPQSPRSRGRAVSPEPSIRISLQPQYQPQPSIHYTYSQSALSQAGIMSRASSEAIFHTSTDADDESESCLYFMGGEVVIRRGDNRANQGSSSRGGSAAVNNAGQSNHSSVHSNMNQMHRYDSTSTLQSTVAHLGTISDETAASGLQAIFDEAAAHGLTPRLGNLLPNPATPESQNSRAPVLPVLDSATPTTNRRQLSRSTY